MPRSKRAHSGVARKVPVFVDDSGRRLRRVRQVGWLLGTLAGLYVALMIASVVVPPGVMPGSLPGFRSAAPTRPDGQRRPFHGVSSLVGASDAVTGSTGLGRHRSDTGSLHFFDVGVGVDPAANAAPSASPSRAGQSASFIRALAPVPVVSRARSEQPRRADRAVVPQPRPGRGAGRSRVSPNGHTGSNGVSTVRLGSRGRSALAPGRS
jgi:hypothetical protein